MTKWRGTCKWCGWPVLAAAVALAGCESDREKTPDDDVSPIDDYVSLSAPLFSIEDVMDVELELNDGDWDSLRYDAPNLEFFAEKDCPAGPRPRSFEWYEASVTVNGESYGTIKVRKKGLLGSMSSTRPSLKLEFDDESPGLIEHMTLNNAVQDLTYSRECLTYHLFEKAGLAAPRCGLANVTVNGVELGVYTHIEAVRPPMLSRHYGTDAANGELYEITTADFTDELTVMFEPKGDEPNAHDPAALQAVADALEADDDRLFSKLEPYVDVESFFTFWAMEVIAAHWDGYSGQTNNSFVYRNPKTDRFEFIPWGTDQSFTTPEDFFGMFRGDNETMPWSLYAHGALSRRLIAHPAGRAQYEQTLRRLLDDVWDAEELLQMVDTIDSTVSPYLEGNLAEAHAAETDALRTLIRSHEQDIRAEFGPDWPNWDRPLNPPHCVDIGHTYRGVLTTVSESLDANLVNTGSGEATDSDGAETTDLAVVRGLVGSYVDEHDDEKISVELAIGPVSDGSYVVVFTSFPSELFFEGSTILLDYGQADSGVGSVDLTTGETRSLGFIATGQLVIEALDPSPGGEVQIAFDAPVATFRL